MGLAYRCEAKSLEGFIQQLAVGLVCRGYRFYVAKWIPQKKDPRKVDAKLTNQYGVVRSKSSRMRRKKAGLGNVQYLRYGRFFVLIATKGPHPFFEREAKSIRDICRPPFLTFGSYTISRQKDRRGEGAHVCAD